MSTRLSRFLRREDFPSRRSAVAIGWRTWLTGKDRFEALDGNGVAPDLPNVLKPSAFARGDLAAGLVLGRLAAGGTLMAGMVTILRDPSERPPVDD